MDNIEKIKRALSDSDFEAIMLTGMPNRRYATGFPSTAGIVLVTREDAYFFVDSRYVEAATSRIKSARVEKIDNSVTYYDKINAVIHDKGIKRLGFEDAVMSCAEYAAMQGKLNAEMVPAQKVMSGLRSVKTEWEVKKLVAAQRLAEEALKQVMEIIHPGVTENSVAAELVYRMLKLGAENVSFQPIVVTGSKSSMPHGVPGDVAIQKGDFVTMDFGSLLDGYCSDMTRTVAVGEPTDEMKKVYDTVLRAQLAGIDKAKAGVSGMAIDKAARDVISAAGYGDYFGHGFGHSLGLEIHEAPNAAPNNSDPMPEGAVISAEPGIYLPGRFGVRIEDVIVLHKNGCENITKAPKELIIL